MALKYNGITEKITDDIPLYRITESRLLDISIYNFNVRMEDVWSPLVFEHLSEIRWPEETKINYYREPYITFCETRIPMLGVSTNAVMHCEDIEKRMKNEINTLDIIKSNTTLQFVNPRKRASKNGNNKVPEINELPILISHDKNSRMNVLINMNKIILVNRELIWIPRDQIRVLKLNVKLNIPDGFFGILIGSIPEDFCECASNLITKDKDISLCLINTTDDPQAILPGKLECTIYILPCYLPEPWEVVNLSEPKRGFIFLLKTSSEITIEPKTYIIEKFNYTFLCYDKIKALVVASKKLLNMQLIAETTIWTSYTLPHIKIFNLANKSVCIPPNTCIAKVIFTCGEFFVNVLTNKALNELILLDSFSRLWFEYTNLCD